MANVEGFKKVAEVLRAKAAELKAQAQQCAVVGYTARYALWVHENKEQKLKGQPRPSGKGVYWGPTGQPKFLEAPTRTMAKELGDIVRKGIAAKIPLAQALLLAGYKLLAASQKLVPVEYDNLRASGFAAMETLP